MILNVIFYCDQVCYTQVFLEQPVTYTRGCLPAEDIPDSNPTAVEQWYSCNTPMCNRRDPLPDGYPPSDNDDECGMSLFHKQ